MASIILSIIYLALATVFTVVTWKFVIKAWVKRMWVYIPDLVKRIRTKALIDQKEVLMAMLWTVCELYLISRIVIMYAEGIAMLIVDIMEVV